MFRARRYRIFLVFAVISVIAFVHFSRVGDWSPPSPGKGQSSNEKQNPAPPPAPAPNPPAPPPAPSPPSAPDVKQADEVPLHGFAPEAETVVVKPDATKVAGGPAGAPEAPLITEVPSKTAPQPKPPVRPADDDEFGLTGQGREDVPDLDRSAIHWSKQPEHFPVASSDIISLPTGKPTSIPKIQFDFAKKGEAIEEKLAVIKESFNHSWTGYKEHAWGHDELRPVYGGYHDPFAAWGATLVDALDTLWIMGLTDEFEEAVEAVKKIDFTTSPRKDIPLFETVIRYLGGFIGAYDISGGKYQALIDKAVELAEILMGAFDTPNRMPVTFYYWAPAYASQPHRASTRVVVAELGSLSLEFTRLAQITGEQKYYDAVARVTNELEKFQDNTKLPGLWPAYLDASGCKKVSHVEQEVLKKPSGDSSGDPPTIPREKLPEREPILRKRAQSEDPLLQDAQPADYDSIRGSKKGKGDATKGGAPKSQSPAISHECAEQGLASPPQGKTDKFTMGGLADSTYEYLPKEYMLLGGLNDQYRNMYKKSMDTVRKYLLFRPMLPDTKRDIRFIAAATASKNVAEKKDLKYSYEGSHLACFSGGMFGVGSKIFGLDKDLDIAKKLTDSCVWAYESTASGIMPESFEVLPCESLDECPWNQTRYYDALDPFESARKARLESWEERAAALGLSTSDEKDSEPVEAKPLHEARQDSHAKRAEPQPAIVTPRASPTPMPADLGEKPVFLSHKEYAEARIKEERIPPGMVNLGSRRYLLRPEAIESVFIMYRITGDDYWREKGWDMFKAIEENTRTDLANSAIKDVTSKMSYFSNEMESFWLAETLKYFYLLFSDPSLVSLDDYVLNTEAHPFKRPS